MNKNVWVFWALCCVLAVARAQSPVDAGQLLEQQRRIEQLQSTPSRRPEPPLQAPAAASPGDTGGPQITVHGFELRGHTLLSEAALQQVLQPWLERPVALAALRQAAAAVEQAYHDAGWLAHVTLPAQDATEGRLRLEVTEARMGRVRLATPDAPLSAWQARQVQALIEARSPSGQPLSLPALEYGLRLAGELPGVSVGGSLQAGSERGSTDVLLQTARTPVLRGDVSMDNAANRSTGSERLSAVLQLDSPFALGEQFGLAASETRGTEYLRADTSLALGPWGWRAALSASALRYRVLSEFNTTPDEPPQGRSSSLGAHLDVPLLRSPRAQWNASLGAETRRQLNQDDGLVAGVMQTTSRARSRSLNAGLDGHAFDWLGRGGQTQASLQGVVGRLDLAGSSDSALLGDAQTEDTQGSYRVLRGSVSRVQSLADFRTAAAAGADRASTGSPFGKLSLAVAFSGQFASRNLNAAEKFYLGGPGGVNAYPNGEAGGSNGHLLNLELRQQLGTGWQLGAFYDRGEVSLYRHNRRAGNGQPLAPDNHVTLQGAGASLAWRGEQGQHLKLVWARRIGDNPLKTNAGTDSDGSLTKNRVWLSAGLSF